MNYPPSGPFHQAINKIPLMKVAYRIGWFVRNFMENEEKVSAGNVIKMQSEVFDDFNFSESFEIIMLLFMLSRYDFLEHIDRDQGYLITPKLLEEFPTLEEWHEKHPQYQKLLEKIDCEHKSLEILFRRRTWVSPSRKFLSLDLGDLLIPEFEEDIFQPFPELEELYLNNNLLGTLPGDIFDPLPKLKKLNLSHNIISRLPIHIFSGNQKLKSLNISNNGIDHRWLQKFKALNRLSHGNLEIII